MVISLCGTYAICYTLEMINYSLQVSIHHYSMFYCALIGMAGFVQLYEHCNFLTNKFPNNQGSHFPPFAKFQDFQGVFQLYFLFYYFQVFYFIPNSRHEAFKHFLWALSITNPKKEGFVVVVTDVALENWVFPAFLNKTTMIFPGMEILLFSQWGSWMVYLSRWTLSFL